jgi:Flp pilus assembly pilin Flp
MIHYLTTWLRLKTDSRAVTALEYGLIGGVIVAVILAGFNLMGGSLSTKFMSVGTRL